MKTTHSVLVTILLGSALAFAACGDNKSATSGAASDTTSSTAPAVTDSTPQTTVQPADSARYTVTGTIEGITQGKDGYMADLKGDDGKSYSMTVSVMRLTNRYTRFNKGDKVTVSGDTIHLGDKVNVLVTDWKKP